MTLVAHLPPTGAPDDLFDAFVGWVGGPGPDALPGPGGGAASRSSPGSNVIVSTPTGSGKSLVAAGAHFAALAGGPAELLHRADQGARVARSSSTCAPPSGPSNVGMMTGDAAVNADAPIICCTAEILANIALRDGADAPTSARSSWTSSTSTPTPTGAGRGRCRSLELPQAQFVLMSATLGDVTRFEADLTRRTGRPTAVVPSAHPARPARLLVPPARRCTRRIEELLGTGQAPVYVVHFTQAVGRRAGPVADERQRVHPGREGRASPSSSAASASPPGSARTLSPLRAPRHRRAPRRDAPQVPAAGGAPGPGRACSRSSAAPTPSASASTCPSARCCSPPCPSTTAPRSALLSAREFHQIAGRAGPGRLRHRRARWWCRPPSTSIENERALAKAGDDPQEAPQGGAQEAARAASCPGASPPSTGWWPPSPSRSRRSFAVSPRHAPQRARPPRRRLRAPCAACSPTTTSPARPSAATSAGPSPSTGRCSPPGWSSGSTTPDDGGPHRAGHRRPPGRTSPSTSRCRRSPWPPSSCSTAESPDLRPRRPVGGRGDARQPRRRCSRAQRRQGPGRGRRPAEGRRASSTRSGWRRLDEVTYPKPLARAARRRLRRCTGRCTRGWPTTPSRPSRWPATSTSGP